MLVCRYRLYPVTSSPDLPLPPGSPQNDTSTGLHDWLSFGLHPCLKSLSTSQPGTFMPGARRVLESHLSKGEVPSPGVSENHYWQDFNHYKMLYGFYYLTCEDRLDPIPQRVHPTQNNSQTAAERPRIQLNSDAVYLETVSDFTGKGFSPSRLPLSPPSDASCKSQAVPVLLTYLLQTGSSNNILLRFF